ncbi:hypothetical protein DPMN_027528 [Dreissena polymorpha]|uniref:Uncharacterized protein n=1 Tax=Dreissena polymorpha TaxID=45954 RepID=A0A9D4REG4_DREPO|nr:hypothetical protein DPMN_027528 [Dreissena polymorpha]
MTYFGSGTIQTLSPAIVLAVPWGGECPLHPWGSSIARGGALIYFRIPSVEMQLLPGRYAC